jgi:pyruvate-formate lyase-activating enzyme
LRHPLIAEAEAAIGSESTTSVFIDFADRFQARSFDALRRTYPETTFCKLLALKLTNLAVANFQYRQRHAVLIARPPQLTIDPTNVCQLACPGCVHTDNADYAAAFDWPRKHLSGELHDRFIAELGPFALSGIYYNYGEPLLHRGFPDMVGAAKQWMMFTHTSTNLSMPLPDPEAIVNSGLDRLVLSIDGASASAYQRYRRHGDFDRVIDNVSRLVAARTALGTRTPYLVWQFLSFEHNAHEAREAIALARRLGVDEIHVDTPFSVEFDDPDLRPVTVPERGRHVFRSWDGGWCGAPQRRGADTVGGTVDAEFSRTWRERFEAQGAPEEGTRTPAPCDWLYQNLTLDGAARVMPCCMAPQKTRRLVFANYGGAAEAIDLVNTPMSVDSRMVFADREAYQRRVAAEPIVDRPYCADCRDKPEPFHRSNFGGDIRALDADGTLPSSMAEVLANWGG